MFNKQSEVIETPKDSSHNVFLTLKLMVNRGVNITFTPFKKDVLLHAIYLFKSSVMP